MKRISALDAKIFSAIPYATDDSLSWYEFLAKVLYKLNEIIDSTNSYFDVDLEEYTATVLNEWYDDGRLEGIINEALFDSKADKTTVNTLLAQLAQTETRLNTGDIYGVPVLDNIKDKKIEVVSGTIRQNEEDRTKWDFISDSAHTPVGVDGVSATASGSNLTINFGKAYSKVISFLCGPDERLANEHQIVLGSSVGLSNAVIKASASLMFSAEVWYDGSSWQYTESTGQALIDSVSFTTRLDIKHKYCPGADIHLTPWNRAGAVVPLIPVLRSVATGNMLINFIDYDGVNVSTPDTGMGLRVSKHYNEGILLDGSNGSEDLNLHLGNIWFMGIFEV